MLLKIDICHEIKRQLKAQRRSVRWLAKQINKDHSTLNRNLKYRSMDSDWLASISDVLNVSFLQMLADDFLEERENRKKTQ